MSASPCVQKQDFPSLCFKTLPDPTWTDLMKRLTVETSTIEPGRAGLDLRNFFKIWVTYGDCSFLRPCWVKNDNWRNFDAATVSSWLCISAEVGLALISKIIFVVFFTRGGYLVYTMNFISALVRFRVIGRTHQTVIGVWIVGLVFEMKSFCVNLTS